MRLIIVMFAVCMLAGCMTVDVFHCGPGDITVNLDKPVSVVPSVQADGNTVPMIP